MDTVHQSLDREYLDKQAKNRARLGAPPEWGAPVMMPPRDKTGQFLASLQMGLSIASTAVSIGTGIGVGTGIGTGEAWRGLARPVVPVRELRVDWLPVVACTDTDTRYKIQDTRYQILHTRY